MVILMTSILKHLINETIETNKNVKFTREFYNRLTHPAPFRIPENLIQLFFSRTSCKLLHVNCLLNFSSGLTIKQLVLSPHA